MKQIAGYENVKAEGEFSSLKAGGYIITILGVENDENKEYLKISYDISEGDFKDYYRDLYKSINFWGGNFYRSYKDSALAMFKGFIQNVEKSNTGYVWNWDELSLKGKKVGVILREEEYIPQGGTHAGEVRTRLVVSKIVDVNTIKSGNFKVPEKKTLDKFSAPIQETQPKQNVTSIDDDSLPF